MSIGSFSSDYSSSGPSVMGARSMKRVSVRMDGQSAHQVASPEPQISMCRVHVSMDFAAGSRCAAWQCWETARALTAERRANSWKPFFVLAD